MTKEEALKLALEALRFGLHVGFDESSESQIKKGGKAFDQHNKAITAIKQTLAAPVQEPVTQIFGEENVELDVYSDDASNGQQWELAGEMEMGQLVGDRPHKSASNPDAEGEVAVIKGLDEYGPMLGWYRHWINFPVGTKLYTTPPAAQPAKGKAPQSANCEAPGRISSDHARDTNYKADQSVAVVSGYYGGQCVVLPTDPARLFNSGTAFYTTPPAAQRQWVGLTLEDKEEFLALDIGGSRLDAMDWAARKLKEKNHG